MTTMYAVEFRFKDGNFSFGQVEAPNHLRAIKIFAQTECEDKSNIRKLDVASIMVDEAIQLFPCADCPDLMFNTPWQGMAHINESHDPCYCAQYESHAGPCAAFSGKSNPDCNCHG